MTSSGADIEGCTSSASTLGDTVHVHKDGGHGMSHGAGSEKGTGRKDSSSDDQKNQSSTDVEDAGSIVLVPSDKTHRMLKGRHIQLIGTFYCLPNLISQ